MNQTGPQPLMPDGSAADPASLGVCVLIANWTKAGDLDYAGAAKSQIDYLFTPRCRELRMGQSRTECPNSSYGYVRDSTFPLIITYSHPPTGVILSTWFRPSLRTMVS